MTVERNSSRNRCFRPAKTTNNIGNMQEAEAQFRLAWEWDTGLREAGNNLSWILQKMSMDMTLVTFLSAKWTT